MMILLDKFKKETAENFDKVWDSFNRWCKDVDERITETQVNFTKEAKEYMEWSHEEVLTSIKSIHKEADDEIYGMVKKELSGIKSQIDSAAWVADKKFDLVNTKLQTFIVKTNIDKWKQSTQSVNN